MSHDDKLEKVSGEANRQLNKASSANFAEPNMASREERPPPDSISSKCASRDTSSSMSESHQQTASEQVFQRPLNSKCLSTASTLQNQSLKPMNKVPQLASDFRSPGTVKGRGYPLRECFAVSNQGERVSPIKGPSNFQSVGLVKGGYPYLMREHLSFPNQGERVFPNKSLMSNKSNGCTWDDNDRFKLREKFQRNGGLNPSIETNRGPRALGGQTPLSSPAKKDLLGLTLVRRDKYNLPTFETKYENAKFFVIKSYNEQDIHKGIKYNVWASTSYGNRKLDAAFHDAERISSETGKTCPIFLFFSANGSGQFVGLAEMTGPVDFEKDMDFWQQNTWNGFFPLEWHIVKDIPNNQLRHIMNENNENRPVTYSRDTQEIGFKQGLEMLAIFKSFPAKTILLDDFDFYENKEKLPPDRISMAESPQTMTNYGDKFLGHSPLMVPNLAPVPSTEATSNSASISDPQFATTVDDEHLRHAHSYDNYKPDADQKRGVFSEGDMVMIYQKRQMDAPHKLQMRRIGPFRILKRVNDKAYKVDLPPTYRNNIFNVANLMPYKGNIVSHVRHPMASHRPPTALDRISVALMKDTVVTSRRTYSMFLVKLKDKNTWLSKDENTWLSEKSFRQMDPEFYERYMAAIDQELARQTREDDAKTQTTSGHEPQTTSMGEEP